MPSTRARAVDAVPKSEPPTYNLCAEMTLRVQASGAVGWRLKRSSAMSLEKLEELMVEVAGEQGRKIVREAARKALESRRLQAQLEARVRPGRRKIARAYKARFGRPVPEGVKETLDEMGPSALNLTYKLLSASRSEATFWKRLFSLRGALVEAISEGARRVLFRFVEQKFGYPDYSHALRIDLADHHDLNRWFERLATAKTADELFTEPR